MRLKDATPKIIETITEMFSNYQIMTDENTCDEVTFIILCPKSILQHVIITFLIEEYPNLIVRNSHLYDPIVEKKKGFSITIKEKQ